MLFTSLIFLKIRNYFALPAGMVALTLLLLTPFTWICYKRYSTRNVTKQRACGLPDHVFDDCPNRAIPIPILQIKIRKPNNHQNASSFNSHEWNVMGKNNKPLPKAQANLFHPNKPYMNENADVKIIYEAEDLTDSLTDECPAEDTYALPTPLIPASDGINRDNQAVYPRLLDWKSWMGEFRKFPQQYGRPCCTQPQYYLKQCWNSGGSSQNGNQGVLMIKNNVVDQEATNEYEPEMEVMMQNYILDSRLPAEMNLPPFVMNEMIIHHGATNSNINPIEELPFE